MSYPNKLIATVFHLQWPPFRLWPLWRNIINPNYSACESNQKEKTGIIDKKTTLRRIHLHNIRKYYKYLLSGDSSPSNLILNRMPTENPFLTVSIYLFKPMINWLVLVISMEHQKANANIWNKLTTINTYRYRQREREIKPWLVVNEKKGSCGNCMGCSGKHS